ncbi:hypothetical protein [Paractinoplanes atraurantiacus]|uniref:PBP domain-containing protein n=1 Tax=Paractinoplanes atraurantiacus TaxID=1036182 RepID=A0A285JPF2_9ACTN|nr:hypothetical protein [Actinoplanes atraurantiacus]SNY62202.1 hypothetical protein SAMN05421748_123102 [Actinoplanes atraurantiacus]
MIRRILAAVFAVALIGVVPPSVATAAEGSAVTVTGRGEFADLKVTVAQTTNLINQVVTVSWTGGKPTVDVGVYLDYLQIMQCWGDDATGPRRDQCQYGALYTDSRGGTWTGSRQVSYGDSLVDKAETLKPENGQPAYVPFTSVTGGVSTGSGGGEFFDATTTNEIPYGRTRQNGTGEEFFEVQTATEAPGLGCGAKLADGTGRSCWLVIVPRGQTEVNGTTGDARPHRWLDSSPLSATNWDQRMVVPLKFQPLGSVCPIGTAERRTVGAEAMTEAMLRWQPTLCAGGDRVYGYSQVTDDLARTRLTGKDPGLVFLNSPAVQNPKNPQLYAPVAVSGLTIALNVDWQSGFDATDEDRLNEGRRITGLKLTPRLVAKLLTQSYLSGADNSRTSIAGNPMTVSSDPEFLKYNPDFAKQLAVPIGDMLVPLGQSDLAKRLWEWVLADPDAKAFLTGAKDPWGMKVNPVYSAQSWPQETFPKSDLYCVKLRSDAGDERDWCTLDMHPYTNNMHDAARYASRGDSLVRNVTARDNVGSVIGWKKGAPQAPGKRALLAVTDVATADRYGLPTAQLMNRSGTFVAPTTEGMLASVGTMKYSTATPGTLEPDPSRTDANAYPLTTVVYGATAPLAITKAAGKDYADLLRYAAGNGQTPGVEPGTLPYGYAPLPAELRTLTKGIADIVEKYAGATVAPPTPTPPASTSKPSSPGGVTVDDPVPPPAAAQAPTNPAPASSSPGVPSGGSRPIAAVPSPKPAGHGDPMPVAQANTTPGHRLGNARYALVAATAVGVVAALAGPALLLAGRVRSGRSE